MSIGRLFNACGWTPTDIYLRSYPLFVTQPKALIGIKLPPDSGSDYPSMTATAPLKPGYTMRDIARMIWLLKSTDRRQRKRGSRLATIMLRPSGAISTVS